MPASGCPHPLTISVSPQNKHNRAHLKRLTQPVLKRLTTEKTEEKKNLKSSETPLWETPMTFPFCSVSKVHLLQSKEWPDFSHDRLTEQDYTTRTLGDENLDDVWHPLAQGTESTWINNEMRDFTFYCCSYHLESRNKLIYMSEFKALYMYFYNWRKPHFYQKLSFFSLKREAQQSQNPHAI